MNENDISIYDRFKGVIYGQAIGDALGLGTEFMDADEMAWKYPAGLRHYSQIFQDRHRKRWKIGDWTDDTDMMLCIADAVIEDSSPYPQFEHLALYAHEHRGRGTRPCRPRQHLQVPEGRTAERPLQL